MYANEYRYTYGMGNVSNVIGRIVHGRNTNSVIRFDYLGIHHFQYRTYVDFFPSGMARENLALVENCFCENSRHVTMKDSGNDINGLMGGTIFGEIVWNR